MYKNKNKTNVSFSVAAAFNNHATPFRSSAEIAISDLDSNGEVVVAPICVVSRVEMMTDTGWRDIDNVTDTFFQQPFQLYRDGDKTYLQVSANPKLGERLGLVSLCIS